MNKYLKIARFDHWIKNIFILPGVAAAFLLADRTFNSSVLLRLLTGLLSTCFIASANYVINEWLDASFDRYHPVKKFRPVVTEHMKAGYVYLEYALFLLLGLGLSLTVNCWFFYMELWLLFMGILYNVKPFRLKDIAYLDVLSESVNNIIRLMLGWFIITERLFPPISLVIGYWMAGAFLMGTKRLAEYRMIGDAQTAGLYRKSFRRYSQQSLLCSSFFYAMCATFCLGIFMVKYRVEYVLSMPLLFLLFAYYLLLSYREDSVAQKPEKLYREKKLLSLVAVFCLTLILLTFCDIPALQEFHEPHLIDLR